MMNPQRQILAQKPAQPQRPRSLAPPKKHNHRHDPVGVRQLRQVQTVVPEPVDGKPPRLSLLLDDKQNRGPAPVRPLDSQRDVEFAETLAESLLH